ncbi:DnaA ATPase domain-containing protein [Megasphaera vaginalis (ex Srinivasan et al. 2021)]|uniref:IstB-like ATP-binding protein n=1 Tax=Megasphaera vaginalis (ex Srinivasan et al. 2021) TaxID=1111454 RepID=U7UMV8_9FIRM|nr:DnaA/Hda family protein [Megasphaera vaginalis (ex Srinivasan et al. 2021)]ERT60777.1 IstB-like ATP-binding protein [Megasphaera vaginalis (ex Srinivasan et al. 2021)]
MHPLMKALNNERESRYKLTIARMKTMAATRKISVTQSAPSDGIRCMKCGNTGWIHTITEDGYDTVTFCPACYERRQVVRRLKKSGISAKDYARYTLQSFNVARSSEAAQMKRAAEKYIEQYSDNGVGFGVFGRSGAGKTHLCIAICQELTKRYHTPHYYFSYRSEMPSLVKAAKSYKDDYEAVMTKWKTCKNLYIDDLFKLSGTVVDGHLTQVGRDELQIMFDIINARMVNHVTTLFSSEYSVKDITTVDEALGSRIYEMVSPFGLRVDGENQRLRGVI